MFGRHILLSTVSFWLSAKMPKAKKDAVSIKDAKTLENRKLVLSFVYCNFTMNSYKFFNSNSNFLPDLGSKTIA